MPHLTFERVIQSFLLNGDTIGQAVMQGNISMKLRGFKERWMVLNGNGRNVTIP